MVIRLAVLTAVAMVISGGTAPLALADPPPPDPGVQPIADAAAPAPPPPPDGAVPSEVPGLATTPDGWDLRVAAKDEFQIAVPPLTTALSSREYLVAGTFTGSVTGSGSSELSGGSLEVGYQIGCGITLNVVKLNGSIGIQPSVTPTGLGNTNFPGSLQIEVFPQPGEVTNVTVDKKSFKGRETRVTLKDIHIKIDGCVGQSFLRSYAVLTSSTAKANDVVAYYGVAKAV